jgi:hypothetical protein
VTGEHRKPGELDDLEDQVDTWLLVAVCGGIIAVAVIAVIAIIFIRR